ncbi:MAG TPA: hypothetical protein VIZ28_06685 [Chitinophagaceae bacterium]
MKKSLLVLFGFLLLIIFNSCLSTLYPFFTEKDVVFNSAIIGEWRYTARSGKGSILFEAIPNAKLSELAPGIRKIAGKGYLATWIDSAGSVDSKYFVFLVRIGNSLYMDHYPAEMDYEKPVEDIFKQHHLKKHSCYRIDIRNNDGFEMKLLERSFLDDLIAKNQIRIHYEEKGVYDNKTIITAPTEELQAYVLKYGDNPKAYNTDYSYNCTRVINY